MYPALTKWHGTVFRCWQRIWKDSVIGPDYRSLDQVLKFPYVPRPRIQGERLERFRWYMPNWLTHAPRKSFDEMHNQPGYILAAFAQRRQQNRKHVQTVIQVTAKFVARTISVRSRWVAATTRTLMRCVLPLPSRSNSCSCRTRSSLGCNARGNISNFVQEKGPRISHFESANLLRYGSGKSAFLVAKELAFQQIKRNRSAIQLYEWPSATRTEIVNRVSNQFFARPGFPQDKHGGISRRHALHLGRARIPEQDCCL